MAKVVISTKKKLKEGNETWDFASLFTHNNSTF